MRVARLGVTPLKGTAHEHPAARALDATGLRHDRRFCLLDPAAGRVLRTIENPRLLSLRAAYDGTRLLVDVPGVGTVEGEASDGDAVEADYWSRRRALRLVPGPWSEVLSGWLGRDVALARSDEAGGIVYDGAVTVVTTSAIRELAGRLGRGHLAGESLLDDAERWRANVLVDTDDAPAFVEDAWLGRELVVGDAVLRVRYGIPRCAVTRYRPRDGTKEHADPLAALARDRQRDGQLAFGLDCAVVTPGLVASGAAASVR